MWVLRLNDSDKAREQHGKPGWLSLDPSPHIVDKISEATTKESKSDWENWARNNFCPLFHPCNLNVWQADCEEIPT